MYLMLRNTYLKDSYVVIHCLLYNLSLTWDNKCNWHPSPKTKKKLSFVIKYDSADKERIKGLKQRTQKDDFSES